MQSVLVHSNLKVSVDLKELVPPLLSMTVRKGRLYRLETQYDEDGIANM
jgi:hypothetical protein